MLVAAHERARRETARRSVDGEIGEAPQQLLDNHATLKTRRRGTEAMMRAVAERQDPFDLAPDVEVCGRASELPLVTVPRRPGMSVAGLATGRSLQTSVADGQYRNMGLPATSRSNGRYCSES